MAKRQTKTANKTAVKRTDTVVLDKPTVQKESIVKPPVIKNNNWEIKDRIYYLMGDKKPISRIIKSANVYWFDEEKGY